MKTYRTTQCHNICGWTSDQDLTVFCLTAGANICWLLKNTHANLIVQTETPVFGNEGIHRISLCAEFNQHHSYGLWDTSSVAAVCVELDNYD